MVHQLPVGGNAMARQKCPTVKGLRVEIFLRPLQKNTTRPLTVGQVGADGLDERGEREGGTPSHISIALDGQLKYRREQIL